MVATYTNEHACIICNKKIKKKQKTCSIKCGHILANQTAKERGSYKGRIAWNKGRRNLPKHTDECKKKISQKLKGRISPMKGRHLSEETKRKISISLRGKNNGNYNRTFSKEHIAKIKENRKYRKIPFKDTKPERFIQSILSVNQITHQKHRQDIIGYPDFFIKPNICIFVDGCYWHGCVNQDCDTGRKTLKNRLNLLQRKKIINDNRINYELFTHGYRVIRMWEHEIYKNPISILNKFMFIK